LCLIGVPEFSRDLVQDIAVAISRMADVGLTVCKLLLNVSSMCDKRQGREFRRNF